MAANREVENYIRQRAVMLGIDPDYAVKVSKSEALNVFDPTKPDRGGDGGSSFGPFQLHYGGVNKAMPNPGLGDEFTKATGLHASDPSTWKQQVDFALNTAKRDGWRQWMGAANSGIPRWAGIQPGTGLTGRPSTNVDTTPGIAPGTQLAPLNGTLTIGDTPVASTPDTPPAATQGPGLLAQIAQDPAKGLAALGKNKDFEALMKGMSGGGGSEYQPTPIIQTGAIQSMEAGDTSRMANAQQMFNALLARKNQNRVPGLSLMG